MRSYIIWCRGTGIYELGGETPRAADFPEGIRGCFCVKRSLAVSETVTTVGVVQSNAETLDLRARRVTPMKPPRLILASKLVAAAMVVSAFLLSALPAGDELDRAKSWLEKEREQGERGDVDAQWLLGFLYQEGAADVPRDYVEAVRWYRLAADQGYPAAMHELGLMYFNGTGVPQDYLTAYMWLNLAAERSPPGDTHAAKARDLIASRLTKAQIAEGQKLARQWVPR